MTPGERAAALDDRLDESLAEFDGMLMREQEELARRRAAEGGGGGSGSQSQSGFGDAAAGSAAEGSGDSDAGGESWGGGAGVPETGEESAQAPEGEAASGRIPPDVGDGSDDDVVARQLREAAMQEEDPELREALWDEYRKYKASGGGE